MTLPFPCWLVAYDRVKRFHYIEEGCLVDELVSDTFASMTVRINRHGKTVTVPPSKVYPTKQAAVTRWLECGA